MGKPKQRVFKDCDFSEHCRGLLTNRGRTLEDAEFENCTFDGWGLPRLLTPKTRSLVRNVRFTNCKLYVYGESGTIFDNVVFNNIAVGVKGPKMLTACVFRHVVFKGKIGGVMMFREDPDPYTPKLVKWNRTFTEANRQFYEKVDWAIDISEMNTSVFEIREGAIPLELVRRNTATQFVVRRKELLDGRWRRVRRRFEFGSVGTSIRSFLETEAAERLFIAAPRSSSFQSDLKDFGLLKEHGFVH